MGATSWRYYTPHGPDPAAALRALQAEVFARGDYLDPAGPSDEYLRRRARQFGQDPDDPAGRAEIAAAERLRRAIATGDTGGLPAADRAVVRRVREFQRLAAQFGASVSPSAGRRPRSIAELRERAGECGTHSVLDIERVGSRAGFAVAAPLGAAAVRRAFGTAEPTRAAVEAGWADVAEGLGRWRARYLAVYRDGEPAEYAFIGCSGD